MDSAWLFWTNLGCNIKENSSFPVNCLPSHKLTTENEQDMPGLLEKEGWAHKLRSLIVSYPCIHLCWLDRKYLYSSVLYSHWMQTWILTGYGWRDRVKEPCAVSVIWLYIWKYCSTHKIGLGILVAYTRLKNFFLKFKY